VSMAALGQEGVLGDGAPSAVLCQFAVVCTASIALKLAAHTIARANMASYAVGQSRADHVKSSSMAAYGFMLLFVVGIAASSPAAHLAPTCPMHHSCLLPPAAQAQQQAVSEGAAA
jgi:hypothetical protein